ncbi:hypothetical protein OROGR_028128 [Orobanche gracilis]
MGPKKSTTGKENVGSSSKQPALPSREQNKGCIKERLFDLENFVGDPERNTVTTPFIQKLLDNGWEKFVSELPNGNPILTLNFYKTFNKSIGQEESATYHQTTVNGKVINFSPGVINTYLGVDATGAVDISTLPDSEVTDERVLRWALVSDFHENIGIFKPQYNQSNLTDDAWFLWMWAACSIYPTSTHSTISIGHLRGIFAICRGVKMDLGTHIYNTICHYAGTFPTRQKMPFPCLITGICRSQKVKIPVGSDILGHGDRLNIRSIALRTHQLKNKRPREEQPEGENSEEEEIEPEDEIGDDMGYFGRNLLERVQGIETSQAKIEASQAEIIRSQNEIIERQDRTEKCFEKLFRFLNIPDDTPE